MHVRPPGLAGERLAGGNAVDRFPQAIHRPWPPHRRVLGRVAEAQPEASRLPSLVAGVQGGAGRRAVMKLTAAQNRELQLALRQHPTIYAPSRKAVAARIAGMGLL